MLTLYLILLAIAALGFGALTLIALSYRKPTQKKTTTHRMEDSDEITIAIDEPINTIEETYATQSHRSTTQPSEDPTLADLGFSALDTIQEEPNLMVTPPTIQSESIKTEPIVFYLLAPTDRPFVGYELLQALLSANLRFGEKRIFHCYEPLEGDSHKILFSVASAVEPGIFDIANIGGFSCPGLCLFMAPDKVDNPADVLELMLDTAQQLAEDLDGQLCNEKREPLTDDEISNLHDGLAIKSY